jgi:hypothetical protein
MEKWTDIAPLVLDRDNDAWPTFDFAPPVGRL